MDTTDAKLDLVNNDMIVRSDSSNRAAVHSNIRAAIASARNTSPTKWQGYGITTSAAASNAYTGLGVILNDTDGTGAGTTPIRTSLDGQSVGINDVLVKYTWYGDANFDGVVNADDYFRVDFFSGLGWYSGDFNYDGIEDADDYFLMDQAFLGQSGTLAAGAVTAMAAVPEPSTCSVLCGLAVLATRRRRR